MVNERLALPAAPTGARAVAAGATAHKVPVTGHAELPELFAPSIATALGGDRRAKRTETLEFEDVAIPIPEQAPSWAHDSTAGTFSSDPAGGFSWRVRPNQTFDAVNKSSGSFYRRAGQRMCAALLTGALLGTFGLGWVGGSASHRLFAPNPATSPLKQRSNAAVRAEGRTSSDTARDAVSPSVRKLSSSLASRPDSAPVALQSGVRSLPRLMPVPETRPMTIEGWTVRDVSGSVAALEGPDGTWRAARGDIVPGLGRVDSIVRWGNYWLVSTSRGLVASE
jgi:hypothetical protein